MKKKLPLYRTFFVSILVVLLLVLPSQAVATTKADTYVSNLAVATWLICEHGLNNLKIAAPTLFGPHEQAMGVRRDWPKLTSTLSKGFAALGPEEHSAIKNRRLTVQYEQKIAYSLFWKSALLFLVILTIVLYWNRRLARQISAQIAAEQAHKEDSQNLAIFKELTDSSGQGIVMATLDASITYMNPALREMLSIDSSIDQFEMNILNFYPHEFQVKMTKEVMPSVMEQGTWTGELELVYQHV